MSGTLLFLANLLLLGLMYFAIVRMVLIVRSEMRGHVDKAGATVSPNAQLRIVQAGDSANHAAGVAFPLHNMMLIGSSDDNDITLRDGYVSGQHAMVRWSSNRWTVEDLGSTNGTFLNGQPIADRQPQPIASADLLTIGDFQLELEA